MAQRTSGASAAGDSAPPRDDEDLIRIPRHEVNEVAFLILTGHEALKGLARLLWQSGRDTGIDCLELYCLIELIEARIFAAADAIAPNAVTPFDPRMGG